MAMVLPRWSPPLEAITACMSVPLSANEDLADLFNAPKSSRVAQVPGDSNQLYFRLLIDKFSDANGHFHFDFGYVRTEQKTNATLDGLLNIVERFFGKLLTVNFESKFLLAAEDIGRETLLGAWKHVNLTAGGSQSQLLGGNIRVNDTVYKEVRWRAVPKSKPPMSGIEIVGSLGSLPVSKDILNIVLSRATAGLQRFVQGAPKKEVASQ